MILMGCNWNAWNEVVGKTCNLSRASLIISFGELSEPGNLFIIGTSPYTPVKTDWVYMLVILLFDTLFILIADLETE